MRVEDGEYYVVKFQNNPQHVRVLANEFLAARLAEHVGLPVPRGEVIEVGQWLIENTAELRILLPGSMDRCRPGLQFGSRYPVDPWTGRAFDYLTADLLPKVRNVSAFAGVLALDKWTCNIDSRQVVFCRQKGRRVYTAVFIDFGHCFGHNAWTFADAPLRGVYAWNDVYEGVVGWGDFQPWLNNIEQFDPAYAFRSAEEIPPEWYGDPDALEGLVGRLMERRLQVRDLIDNFRKSPRHPFPNWKMPSLATKQSFDMPLARREYR